jgi:hypothetical protein
MERSALKSLSSLSLGPERKCKCYKGYFINGYVFHIEEYGQGRKTYNSDVCVKGSTSSELEVDYYGRLEEVVELQYHNEQIECFYSNAIDMTRLTEESEFIHTMVCSKSTQKLDSAT